MHKRISDEEKRLRSINAYVVLFVFFIMVSAGIICVMIYNILSAFGLMKHIEVVPMLMPLIMLCSCVIIGSILSAMLSGILLRPLNDLKEGLLRVSKGDFSVRVKTDYSSPELDELAGHFNKMVQELGSIEALRNDFAANISHEFRTPLAAIEGYTTLL